MSGLMKFTAGRRRTRLSTSDASASSSRRHSVSESPRSMEEDNPAPRSDMLLLGGMRDPRSSSMRFTEGMPPPARRSTRSSAPPPYKPKNSEYGFIILSKEEEERLKFMKGRLRANYDFDDEALVKLGFHHDIYELLENIGWKLFSDGVTVDMQEEVALEMFMTLEKSTEVVDDEKVPCLKFRLKNEEKVITYGEIGSLLGFKSNAYEMVQVEDGELDEFWTKIAKDVNHQRKNISNVTLQIFHYWLSKKILGRMRESKVTDQELNWMYAALVKKQVIDPTNIMVERWLCEASSGTREVGSGCYLTMIARAMNPRLRVIQKFYVPGRDIGIDHLRQGHYIGGDEKKGFTIFEIDISLPDQRLKLFARGRTDWRVENIGKKVKKSKTGRLIEGTSASAQQEDLDVNLPPPSSAYWRNEFQGASSGQGYPQGWTSQWEGGQEQAWGHAAAAPPPFSNYGYPPSSYQGEMPDPSFGAQYFDLPQPEQGTRIMGAYARRNMEDIDAIRWHTTQLEDGTAGIAYQMGLLGLTPPEQFNGGAFQQYYDQGYNARANQGD